MVVKKVITRCKNITKSERIKLLLEAIVESKTDDASPKCKHWEAVNFITKTFAGNIYEMTALAQDAKRSKDPIDHWILSWPSEESPTIEQSREAVNIFITHCGLKSHQHLWAIHGDTDNKHIHIAVNKIHSDSAKVIDIPKEFELNAAYKAIAAIQEKQGWQTEVNTSFIKNDVCEIVINNSNKTYLKSELVH